MKFAEIAQKNIRNEAPSGIQQTTLPQNDAFETFLEQFSPSRLSRGIRPLPSQHQPPDPFCWNPPHEEKGETGEKGARPWMEKREKPCPGWRKRERRALVGTDGKRALEKRA
ncbi:hypothetical protein TNCV_5062441 [Trichonephila clavipes]|nr:hypothetical protein TNCV_5062441 [Trichonephila clavipes]